MRRAPGPPSAPAHAGLSLSVHCAATNHVNQVNGFNLQVDRLARGPRKESLCRTVLLAQRKEERDSPIDSCLGRHAMPAVKLIDA
ncbi:hypothetical protein EVAR_69475_1 [Eumeta japonica]|uniref:Uncharacterized protein n=1 Tax=Eumeta variegata TaxID=151549 RepID=A0A4C1SCX4_EUMVA|nr:hypothetical protein EVAR_69475_1 [Eumeta japonica]